MAEPRRPDSTITPETPLDETPAFWGVRDFCSYFSVCPNTFYAGVKAGTIPSVRIAGQIRVSRDELAALLRKELEATLQRRALFDGTYDPFGQPPDGYAEALKREKK